MTSIGESDPEERLSVLLATYWPRGTDVVEIRSPVNLYRAFFNAFFDARLPLLKDRSFLSTFVRPYEFVEWTPTEGTASRSAGAPPRSGRFRFSCSGSWYSARR